MNNCPGVGSKEAGIAEGCKKCPNAQKCQESRDDPVVEEIKQRMKKFKKIICVMCGKGGVGKSFLSFNIAKSISKNFKTTLLDFDLSGPSQPRLTSTMDFCVHDVHQPFKPAFVEGTDEKLAVISSGHCHLQNSQSTVYDSQKKNSLIRQILRNCVFNSCDFLVVDTPPNITDEHIALYNFMMPCSAILISTSGSLAISDLKRQVSFCKKTGIKIEGVVENMRRVKCNSCNHLTRVSPSTVAEYCSANSLPFLGDIPFDPIVSKRMDNGEEVNIPEIDDILSNIIPQHIK